SVLPSPTAPKSRTLNTPASVCAAGTRASSRIAAAWRNAAAFIGFTPDPGVAEFARIRVLHPCSRIRKNSGAARTLASPATGDLPTDAQTAPFEQGLDFDARDPGEIAWDGMLEGAGRHAEIEAFLRIAIEQAVNQARCKRIACAEAIHNFHFV